MAEGGFYDLSENFDMKEMGEKYPVYDVKEDDSLLEDYHDTIEYPGGYKLDEIEYIKRLVDERGLLNETSFSEVYEKYI